MSLVVLVAYYLLMTFAFKVKVWRPCIAGVKGDRDEGSFYGANFVQRLGDSKILYPILVGTIWVAR